MFVSAFGFYVASDPAAAQEYARDFGVSAFIAGSVGRALEASGRGRWLALVIGLVASSAYGALGVAVAALAWLYFSGRAVVAGAVLNVTLWERHVARNAGSCPRDEAGGTRARKDLRP